MIPEAMLTEGLRVLLESDKGRHFLHAPMVVPESEWFPDPWTPDAAGVHGLIRRIMYYVGLGDVPCAIERFVYDGSGGTARGRHAIAFFEGLQGGVCRFGVNCAQLGDPEFLIGVLAHEAAHAYRAIHGLAVEDHAREEELTDLTTVFLGFGVFTTNNAQRTTEYGGGRLERRAGYLSPQAMVWALATWTRARAKAGDEDAAERWLEPVQRGMYLKEVARLDTRGVRSRLGLPRAEADAPPRGRALPELLRDAPAAPDDAEPIDFATRRGETFRVLVRRQWWAFPLGVVSAAFAAAAGDIVSPHGLATVALGSLIGGGIGGALSYDECAACGFRVPQKAACCARCGAVVRGVLPSGTRYQDALETLRQERVRARRARSLRAG